MCSKTSLTKVETEAKEFLNILPSLTDRIRCNINPDLKNDSETFCFEYLPSKLKPLINSILNAKLILNNLLKTILQANAASKFNSFITTFLGLDDSGLVYEPLFEKMHQNKLDKLILSIVFRLVRLSLNQIDANTQSNGFCSESFFKMVKDMKKLIDLNRKHLYGAKSKKSQSVTNLANSSRILNDVYSHNSQSCTLFEANSSKRKYKILEEIDETNQNENSSFSCSSEKIRSKRLRRLSPASSFSSVSTSCSFFRLKLHARLTLLL